MSHNGHHRNTSGYTIQTAIALILFILGLMLLVIWAILYANRLSNNLKPEWWIWFFLGFGVGLMVIGLIWLIIVQYIMGSKAQEMYEDLCQMERDKRPFDSEFKKPSSEMTTRRSTGSSFAHNE